MADRDRILFDLCMALRKVPRGILRDLGKPRLPRDELAEKIVAKAIVEHLELCGWRPGAQGPAYGDAGPMIGGRCREDAPLVPRQPTYSVSCRYRSAGLRRSELRCRM